MSRITINAGYNTDRDTFTDGPTGVTGDVRDFGPRTIATIINDMQQKFDTFKRDFEMRCTALDNRIGHLETIHKDVSHADITNLRANLSELAERVSAGMSIVALAKEPAA